MRGRGGQSPPAGGRGSSLVPARGGRWLPAPVPTHVKTSALSSSKYLHGIVFFPLIVPSANLTFTVVANSHPGTWSPDPLSFWLLVWSRAAAYPPLLTATPPEVQAARSRERLSVLSLEAPSGEKPGKCEAACFVCGLIGLPRFSSNQGAVALATALLSPSKEPPAGSPCFIFTK